MCYFAFVLSFVLVAWILINKKQLWVRPLCSVKLTKTCFTLQYQEIITSWQHQILYRSCLRLTEFVARVVHNSRDFVKFSSYSPTTFFEFVYEMFYYHTSLRDLGMRARLLSTKLLRYPMHSRTLQDTIIIPRARSWIWDDRQPTRGSYTMAIIKPIKFLELHYTMTWQFLIIWYTILLYTVVTTCLSIGLKPTLILGNRATYRLFTNLLTDNNQGLSGISLSFSW